MAEGRSRKVSTLIFLFAIFIMLAVFTGSWIYKMYSQNKAFTEDRTVSTVECSRYYYNIRPETVLYENGTLYFEIENNIGADIGRIIVESSAEKKEVDLGGLSRGIAQPVTVQLDVVGWVLVYPVGCQTTNFKNLSFEPRTA
ncbi:hypothetical protein KY363_01215 [Candidatus Woesearchaeota archaeon]|nr:hypothetical protein [Candidatus Woesearchaeota archaeon]